MATIGSQAISRTPVNLVSSLSLAVGTRYTFQNVGSARVIWVDGGSASDRGPGINGHDTPPASGIPAGIGGLDWGSFTPSAGDGIWMWTESGLSVVVVSED